MLYNENNCVFDYTTYHNQCQYHIEAVWSCEANMITLNIYCDWKLVYKHCTSFENNVNIDHKTACQFLVNVLEYVNYDTDKLTLVLNKYWNKMEMCAALI